MLKLFRWQMILREERQRMARGKADDGDDGL